MDPTEVVPAVWDEEAEAFFYVVAHVFQTAFLFGSTVLLATYDPPVEDPEPISLVESAVSG